MLEAKTSINQTADTLSMENVYKDMQQWRATKDQFPKQEIPDELWRNIFKLTKTYGEPKIRNMFGLSNKQYELKYNQLCNSTKSPIPISTKTKPAQAQNVSQQVSAATIDFCEVDINGSVSPLTNIAHETKASVKQLKSSHTDLDDILDTTTIIVECIHPNGHRLKIHTTTQRIDQVMQAFFNAGGSA